jgi:hypothetical protein
VVADQVKAAKPKAKKAGKREAAADPDMSTDADETAEDTD